MKIIAFGASYSKRSINKQFASFAAKQFKNAEALILDLNDYTVPLFTVDVEAENGHPEIVRTFISKLEEADLLIISMAEHNGNHTAAFKNLFDWASRVKLKMFEGKKMLLLSTSPGGRGGANSMEAALKRFPIHGAEIIANFSLPSFTKNFDAEKGILDEELKKQFDEAIKRCLNL